MFIRKCLTFGTLLPVRRDFWVASCVEPLLQCRLRRRPSHKVVAEEHTPECKYDKWHAHSNQTDLLGNRLASPTSHPSFHRLGSYFICFNHIRKCLTENLSNYYKLIKPT